MSFIVSCNEAVVGPDLDLMEATEMALSAEVALILLSPSSVPKTWKRKDWENVFFEKPKQFQTHLGFVLVSDCTFPAVFRRARFFDASDDWLAGAREIKPWLPQSAETAGPASRFAPELEQVGRAVGDRPGIAAGIIADIAVQFVEECGADFEAAYRFDCRGRSRAGIAGDIGSALGLPSFEALREWCASHRILFILAGVNDEDRDFVTPGGRASLIFTEPLTDGLPGSVPSAPPIPCGSSRRPYALISDGWQSTFSRCRDARSRC